MPDEKPPLPPFSRETAAQKVQAAEDACNTRDPERVALAYSEDSVWSRAELLNRADAKNAETRKPLAQSTGFDAASFSQRRGRSQALALDRPRASPPCHHRVHTRTAHHVVYELGEPHG